MALRGSRASAGTICACEHLTGKRGPQLARTMPRCAMTNEQLNSPDTLCAKCGAEARWNFLDEAKQAVEVVCPNCGRIEMTVAEFEQAEFDTAPAEERRS